MIRKKLYSKSKIIDPITIISREEMVQSIITFAESHLAPSIYLRNKRGIENIARAIVQEEYNMNNGNRVALIKQYGTARDFQYILNMLNISFASTEDPLKYYIQWFPLSHYVNKEENSNG